jgi:hypothetical protein
LVSVRDNLRQKGFSETATKHISTEIEDFVLREALVAWHRTDAVDLQTKLVLAKLEQ